MEDNKTTIGQSDTNSEKIKKINGLLDELQKELESVNLFGKNLEADLFKNIDKVKIKKISGIIEKIPN